MAVSVIIKGSEDSLEYKDALFVKNKFEEYFKPHINGEIILIPSATLYGQDVKDIDLVILGKLDNYHISNIETKFTDARNKKDTLGPAYKDVYINNFCIVVEIKGHRAEGVSKEGSNIFVKYGDKIKNVTEQSERQKYSLLNFFRSQTTYSPIILNFIWFNNMSAESLSNLVDNRKDNNYISSDFNLSDIFSKCLLQHFPRSFFDNESKQYKKAASFDCFFGRNNELDLDAHTKFFDLFTKNKEGMGSLTRSKLERLNKKLFKSQAYADDLGKKLIIFSGKAGTGKTSKLLNAAFDLAQNHDSRCLILTYNHALVSDIKRLIALQGISDDIGANTVHINTLHKFFRDVLEGFEIGTKKNEDGIREIENFLHDDTYYKLLDELVELIDEGLIDDKEIQDLMCANYQTIDFEYVLVDECQDWDEREKIVLYKLFGQQHVILAEGFDQLVRTTKKCNWVYGMRPKRDFNKTNENKSLRQKKSLVRFVNSYAEKVGLNWTLEAKEEMDGGKIIIKVGEYSESLHAKLLNDLYKHENVPYDMLFFTPPKNVSKKVDERGFSTSYFNKIEYFTKIGVALWDGTTYQFRNKSNYPVNPEQHRIFQFDSCRGLEGWTVVCLDFDEFVKYKMETFVEEKVESGMDELALETFEEKRDRNTFLWSLIPLTRPIDTLVITIAKSNSKIYNVMKEIYNENSDVVEWLE